MWPFYVFGARDPRYGSPDYHRGPTVGLCGLNFRIRMGTDPNGSPPQALGYGEAEVIGVEIALALPDFLANGVFIWGVFAGETLAGVGDGIE